MSRVYETCDRWNVENASKSFFSDMSVSIKGGNECLSTASKQVEGNETLCLWLCECIYGLWTFQKFKDKPKTSLRDD